VLHDGQDVLSRRDIERWLDPAFVPVDEIEPGLDRRWIGEIEPSAHTVTSRAEQSVL
jgi:hypothetical protein